MVDMCEFFRREGGQEKCLAQLKLKFYMQKLKIEMYQYSLLSQSDFSEEFQAAAVEIARGPLKQSNRMSFS